MSEGRGWEPTTDEEIEAVLPSNDLPQRRRSFARAILDCLADVEPQKVVWMEPGFLPYGKLVLLEGDPGVNKSTLALHIAACLTRGWQIFGSGPARRAQNVLLISFEDGVADTIRPRVDALGGDPKRIFVFRGVATGKADEERQPILPDDIPLIKAMIEENNISFVIVDPLGAGLSEGTDSHKDASVRRVTGLLARLAEETDVCLFAIRHLIKGAAANAMRAGGGSIAFIAAARVAMVVHLHPDDIEKPQHERRRVLACVKNNLAPFPASRMFELVPPADSVDHPTLRWVGETALSADDLNAAHSTPDSEERAASNERAEWLREVLSGGPVASKDVYRVGRETGHNDRALRRTAKLIGVTIRREGAGAAHRSYWELRSCSTPALRTQSPERETVSEVSEVTPKPSGGIRILIRDAQEVQEVSRLTAHGDGWFPVRDEQLHPGERCSRDDGRNTR